MHDQTSRERFRRDGYLPPQPLLRLDEARAAAARCYEALGVDPRRPGPTQASCYAWHHRQRWAFDLGTDPRLLDRVEDILGPDIVLWAMACWYKEPRTGKRVPWHQDSHYWPMSPATTASVWLALGPAEREDGCLRVMPGSQRRRWPHAAITDATSWFDQGIDGIEQDGAVDLEMAEGEAVLFDEGILHGSEANRSHLPRLGVSFRYSPPEVRFLTERWGDAPHIRTFLVRGQDRFRLNAAIQGEPPPPERAPSAADARS